LSAIRDRAKRAWLGHGTSQLSELFLAPDSVDHLHHRCAGWPTPRAVTQCCGNCFRRRPKCAEVVLRVSVLRHPQTRVLVGPRTRTLHRWQVVKAQRRACAAAAPAAARRIAARILVPRDRTSVAGASHRSQKSGPAS
jgi:hypothetical protein